MDYYFNKKKITQLCLWSPNESEGKKWIVRVIYGWTEDGDCNSEDLKFETKSDAGSFINSFGFIKYEGV
jgi:hypothetical protein